MIIMLYMVADFDPFQTENLYAESDVFTLQFTHKKFGSGEYSWLANQRQNNLPDASYYEDVNKGSHNIESFFDDISKLKEGKYVWDGSKWIRE